MITAEYINGIVFGIEHVPIDEEENGESGYLIAVHFLCFRFCFVKLDEQ